MLMEAKLGTMVCPKCFAEIPDTSAFCMECGSRIREDTIDPLYAEGSDREVYPELARANLLRMQGKYEEAIEVCRRIMGRFPSNETVHALLGRHLRRSRQTGGCDSVV
jgi:predicted amidophosphoribosyltransferase